jgi:hypothetical protein
MDTDRDTLARADPERRLARHPGCPIFDATLVLLQDDIVMFRATQIIQDKAQPAGNGSPFTRAATQYCIIWVAPFGRAGKRSPAVLRLLERASHSLRGAPRLKRLLLVRSNASRFAERDNIILKEYLSHERRRRKPPAVSL